MPSFIEFHSLTHLIEDWNGNNTSPTSSIAPAFHSLTHLIEDWNSRMVENAGIQCAEVPQFDSFNRGLKLILYIIHIRRHAKFHSLTHLIEDWN